MGRAVGSLQVSLRAQGLTELPKRRRDRRVRGPQLTLANAERLLEQLLVGWKAQGWRLVSMRTLLDTLQPLALPRCEVGPGVIEGRSGTLLMQRDEFLADVDLAA